MISVPFIAAGLAVGGGVGLLVRELLPGAPDLGQALERLNPTSLPTSVARPAAERGWRERIGAKLLERAETVPWITVPRTDLAVLRRAPELYLFNKFAGTLGGALVVPYFAVMAELAGYSVPYALPLIACPLLGVLFYLAADSDLRTKAKRARREVHWALCSYIDLVALKRAGESGVVDALEGAARLADGWVFLRLRGALEQARLERIAPWDGLRRLAVEIEVPALTDIADIVSWSGRDGAAVYSALRSKGAGMRTALGNQAAEDAAAATVKLTMVGALLSLLLMVLIGYPAFSRMLAN